jgi:hypothetical protein
MVLKTHVFLACINGKCQLSFNLFYMFVFIHGRPQTFSKVEGKNFQRGGGQGGKNLLKKQKKDTIFLKKSLKHTIFGRPEEGKSPPCPRLRTLMFPSQLGSNCGRCPWIVKLREEQVNKKLKKIRRTNII